MTPLVLAAVLLTAQPREDAAPIAPAPTARNLYRVQLLPGLLDQTPGEVLDLAHQAEAELNRAVPDRFNAGVAWKREADALLAEDLTEIAATRFEAVLKPVAKSLDLWEQAARARRADWSSFATHLRQRGPFVGSAGSPDFALGAQLFALQARQLLKQDRPANAVRRLGLALSLLRHATQNPRSGEAVQAAFFLDTTLDVLHECQCHPRCPGLYDALAALPRPFLSLRPVCDGLRLGLYGALPGSERILADPAGATLDAEEMTRLAGTYRLFRSYAGQGIEPLAARVQLGLAIQRSDAAARAAMREAGYAPDVVAATPPLNAAILHALFAGEATLGRQVEALSLPIAAAQARLTLQGRPQPRAPAQPGDPALPVERYVRVVTENVLVPFASAQRRLDLLRAVEALRLHAHRTGSLPAKLDDIRAAAVPVEPLTGQPFHYERDGDRAALDTPEPAGPVSGLTRVTLRLRLVVPDKKP
jgi:hypothetical protein